MRSTKSTQDIFPDTISTTNNIEFHRSAAATTAAATTAAATLQTSPQYPLGLQKWIRGEEKNDLVTYQISNRTNFSLLYSP